MTPLLSLHPDSAAADLADRMLAREDVGREILEETLASAEAGAITESGRTVCGRGRELQRPVSREYSRVSLPTCPLDVGGTWHTHITEDQLLNPANSLPDAANVVFGVIDVSIVAGAESSHVVVASADRERMRESFRDVLGVDVDDPGDVARAVLGGEVADPPAARRALYERWPDGIAYRVDTAAPALAERVQETELTMAHLAAPGAAPAVAMSGCTMYDRAAARSHSAGMGRMERVCRQGRSTKDAAEGIAAAAPVGSGAVREQIVTTTVSVTIGNAVERLLFG